jgi:hypothetical protein
MRRDFETCLVIDLYSEAYRQQLHTEKAQKSGFFETQQITNITVPFCADSHTEPYWGHLMII